MPYDYTKITAVDGFDAANINNARQNNYSWSMAEMEDYIYVGTGKNIFYNIIDEVSKRYEIPFIMPEELTPKDKDDRAEIWRYNKKDSFKNWELVFKSPKGVDGFRFMICYTSPSGQTSLYAGGDTNEKIRIFKSSYGSLGSWHEISNQELQGSTTRAMLVHKEKLYLATFDNMDKEESANIYVSMDPEKYGWKLTTPNGGDTDKNPAGGVISMISFNNHIYAGTSGKDGFELWRTTGDEPELNKWQLVIDKGAGDAVNIAPLTLGIFKDHLYVGAMAFPFTDRIKLTGFKPFDIIRVDKNDHWEVVVGGRPVEPTDPATGRRNTALSGMPSGLGIPTNLYCWQLQEYNGEFYLGTFDWSVLIIPMLSSILNYITSTIIIVPEQFRLKFYKDILRVLLRYPIQVNTSFANLLRVKKGFDLYTSRDGIHWRIITLTGFDNPHNYGARNLLVSENGHLYIGTANPFNGCEVWKNKFCKT